MMKYYEKPEFDVINFNLQDVIRTSGLTNEGDNNDDESDASDAEGELYSVRQRFFG